MNTFERIAALCLTHPDRHVGGAGNRAANGLFADEAAARGFVVERLQFAAREWVPGAAGASVELAGGECVALQAGPFSAAFDGDAPLVSATTVEELEALDRPGAILLLHGKIAAEQITPRNYPFYQLDAHTRILEAIDRARPAAVIAATDRTSMAAALSPFPLFEDGDFGHTSAYLHAREAERLLTHADAHVRLRIDSSSRLVAAEQIVARMSAREIESAPRGRRVVVCAHIDSRYGTPGALDNAAGVAVLLALADLLGSAAPALDVELVPFNGEDDFAAPGETAYLAQPSLDLSGIELVVNIDAVARCGDGVEVSFYECPAPVREAALAVAETLPGVGEGPAWPMSDHMVFAMRGVPAIAITSSGLAEIASTVAHTKRDTPELVDPELVEKAAAFIAELIERLPARGMPEEVGQ